MSAHEETPIVNYPHKSFDHAAVAVDVVLFTIIENQLNVLLLELNNPQMPNTWALPGGLVTQRETLEEAARRHLTVRSGAGDVHIEQLASFGDPDRDPNGWVVSVAYLGLVNSEAFEPHTSARYKSIAWKPVKSLPKLAFDHEKIVKSAVERLQNKIEYTNIIYSLMPQEFTLTDLQSVYEIILDRELDKRNFRKKILSLDLISELPKKATGLAHRPATLYTFEERTPKNVAML